VARRTAALASALAEKDVLLKEVHHRVKNNLQVVAALLQLRAKRSADPAGREAFAETLRRIKAMSLVHEALYGGVGGAAATPAASTSAPTWARSRPPRRRPSAWPNGSPSRSPPRRASWT
jgi:hypothetical protein